jgi:carbonic anhydrase/acetyltransferase-like protein (isoleucine patch superfamily)
MAIIRSHRGFTPRIGRNVYLADDAVILGEVVIEDDVSIWWGSVLRGDCGAIVVGKGSNIQDGCMVHATTDHSTTTLGPNVSVGHHAVVHGATVEEGVLVGMKSVLLDNARVGAYSIVAAGAVVMENTQIPADSLVAGVPAQIKRRLDAANRQARLDHAQEYRDLAAGYLAEMDRT